MAADERTCKNNVDKSDNKPKINTIYFGVYVPNDSDRQHNVFEDKEAALKAAKKNKKSRFKAFNYFHEAVEFANSGSECLNWEVDWAEPQKKDFPATGEKASPFRTLRPQDLIEFRNKIEQGDLATIQGMIDYNPRYLVSSGDTPSILQEGARLNALHVAAKAHNAAVVELILTNVSNTEVIKRLYGDDNEENAKQRCKMLLDLYLNTPNKGANDTPLHIASKWGAVKVLEVLMSFPQCDKTKRNKFNKLAEEVICERADSKTPEFVKKRIQELLYDNYYVPVLRSEDNSVPPLVGQPFSPTSPPMLNEDPLSPRLEIHAYAGPMEKQEAESFRKAWKTPPRSLSFNSPAGKIGSSDSLNAIRLKDHEKGLERIGKNLASNYKVYWQEYWEFLDCFIDISSDQGLEALESHLDLKMKEHQDAFEVFSPLIKKCDNVISPITSLCNAFSACRIQDTPPVESKQSCHPLVYVDKACQVFAYRVLANVLSVINSIACSYESIVKNAETDVKLLELLMCSYMEDERFSEWVNFQKVHSRLAHLVATKLMGDSTKESNLPLFINKLESFLESIVKRSDYFSSDDEGPNCKETNNKPTVYRKQVVCLWSRIKNYLETSRGQSDQLTSISPNHWEAFDVCSCVFHPRKPKRNNSSRNSSFKNHTSRPRTFNLQTVSKKLCFGEDDNISTNNVSAANSDRSLDNSDGSKSDTEEDFFTPPSSPSRYSYDSDSRDEFSDAEPPKLEIFLEGSYPTKTDCAVYKALQYADCSINRSKFPLVYKWYHSVSLYTSSERESWPHPHKHQQSPQDMHSPKVCLSSMPSWLRITGVNSPKAAFKTFSPHH